MTILGKVFFKIAILFKQDFLHISVLNDEILPNQTLNLIWAIVTNSGLQET